jgi:hypothetical protein
MKKHVFLPVIMVVIFMCQFSPDVAHAEVTPKIATAIKALLTGYSVTEINDFKIPDMYEVVIDKTRILYVHLPTNIIFNGQVYLGTDGTNLTGERSNALVNKFTTNILAGVDKSKALKIGAGPVELVEFVDVDSKFSREVETYLADKNDVFTRYLFLLPLRITPKTIDKTRYILSLPNRHAAFNKAMAGEFDKAIPEFTDTEGIRAQIAYTNELMNRYKIEGSPTLVWSTGFMEGFNLAILENLVKETRESAAKK